MERTFGSCQETDNLYEVVETESDYEPEPPCTMVDCQGSDVFDIPEEARMRGLDEHELLYFVFEHGVQHLLRLAECHSGQERARDRQERVRHPGDCSQEGWDEHELMHIMFEYGEQEGMRRMEEVSLEDDANSVVFQGGVVQELRVCLALDELIPVNEVRQASKAPEPAKSVQILFRGQHGLGVWKLAAEQSLAKWFSAGKVVGGLEGYFATVGRKIADSAVEVGTQGLGHMSEVVFHRRLLDGSFGGMVKGGCLPGSGECTCSNCGKTDCSSTRYSCCRCVGGMEQGHSGAGPGKRIQRMQVGLVCLVGLGRRLLALLRWVRARRRGN